MNRGKCVEALPCRCNAPHFHAFVIDILQLSDFWKKWRSVRVQAVFDSSRHTGRLPHYCYALHLLYNVKDTYHEERVGVDRSPNIPHSEPPWLIRKSTFGPCKVHTCSDLKSVYVLTWRIRHSPSLGSQSTALPSKRSDCHLSLASVSNL